MKRVLITGGCGFIGSHLCDELIAHGYNVRVLDNLDPQVHGPDADVPSYLNSKVEFEKGDVDYGDDVSAALRGIDVVVHLAAKVGVAQSMYEMNEYVWNNTYGTAILLQRMQESSVKRLIVASSMSVYGEGPTGTIPISEETVPIPASERHEIQLASIYALTKYDQERMCLLFGRAYNVPTVALRFFNVYGSHQSLSNPYTGAMAIFASRLLNGNRPIIYEDGQQRRDFVHVSDVVRGIRLALESDVKDEVFNIGSGRSYTILEMCQRLTEALGIYISPEITGQHRTGDIRHCFADITKAQQLLGYEPQMTLEQGIAELIPWLRTQTAVDKVDEHRAELTEKGLLT